MNIENFGPFRFARLGSIAIRDLSSHLDRFVAGRLWIKILIALVMGLIVGFLLGPSAAFVSPANQDTITTWLAFPGQIFLSLIQLVVIPLVFASVVLGVVSGDSIRQLRALGLRVGVYYIITTVVAISIGFLVAYTIKPGKGFDISALPVEASSGVSAPIVDDNSTAGLKVDPTHTVKMLIPDNPFNVMANGDMLQVVLLALFLGIAMMSLKDEEAQPLLSLFSAAQKISMVVIGWAMKLAPIAVFCLTAKLLAQLGVAALVGVLYYVLTVVTGLAIVFAFYLLLVWGVARYNPWKFMAQIREVQLLAFSTSSSASVMPLTLSTAQEKLGVSPAVAQFTIPLGTTINMDGTALYQGVATVFLAQVFAVDLSFAQLALVTLTATMSSIGAPGAPGVGMAVLATILSGVGIPASGIVIIMGVDRILDMCRTVINVSGDLASALVMNRLSRDTIEKNQTALASG